MTEILRLLRAAALCVAVCFAGFAAASDLGIPAVAYSPFDDPKTPVWVSERAALTSSKELKQELFVPHLIDPYLKMSGDRDASGCSLSTSGPLIHQAVDATSIDTLTRSSTRILQGEVVGRESGFVIGAAVMTAARSALDRLNVTRQFDATD
jgi:hypothetical protein